MQQIAATEADRFGGRPWPFHRLLRFALNNGQYFAARMAMERCAPVLGCGYREVYGAQPGAGEMHFRIMIGRSPGTYGRIEIARMFAGVSGHDGASNVHAAIGEEEVLEIDLISLISVCSGDGYEKIADRIVSID